MVAASLINVCYFMRMATTANKECLEKKNKTQLKSKSGDTLNTMGSQPNNHYTKNR